LIKFYIEYDFRGASNSDLFSMLAIIEGALGEEILTGK